MGGTPPPVSKKVNVPETQVLSCMKAGYCSMDQIVRVVANDPSQSLYPFFLFDILIVAEEVLDLITHYG
jgi:hypothetical protein